MAPTIFPENDERFRAVILLVLEAIPGLALFNIQRDDLESNITTKNFGLFNLNEEELKGMEILTI